jgi:hypothetical protein
MTNLTPDKLKDMLQYTARNSVSYDVYSTNIPKNDYDGFHWEWIPLTVGVLKCVEAGQIMVSNFRTTESLYEIREPRSKPKLLYPARKTGKKYNHTKTIDLFKKDDSFKSMDFKNGVDIKYNDESGCKPPRPKKKYPSC